MQKEPLELTYQIYEKTIKRIKLDNSTDDKKELQTDWKEVQLRISENGEMSVTGIQDSIEIINEPKIVEKEDIKANILPLNNPLGQESKEKQNVAESKAEESCKDSNSNINNVSDKIETVTLPKTSCTTSNSTTTVLNNLTSATTATSANSQSKTSVSVTCATIPVTTTTDCRKNSSHPVITSTSSCGTKLTLKYKNVNSEKKHKLDLSKNDDEPPEKQSKPTILNHTLGVEKLSNNHPLKKHSQLNRSLENSERSPGTTSTTTASTTTTAMDCNSPTTSAPSIVVTSHTTSKSQNTVVSKMSTTPIRPGTPITTPSPKWNAKSSTPPCYVPKTTYSPIINIPNVQPSTSGAKSVESNKLTVKSKPSTPIGYKTLRDPPKSWNPQLPRPNFNKSPDSKYPDKNVRPAKFFKMRNNMPRYLGNPASGVKPLYQVHMSPDKEKAFDTIKTEKSEIKKHSIVKIDPKTLKPISERAPETSNLSNQSDLKINTSSVSIFNPLKLQSSPKGDRKSPKSPHSPKKSTSPTNKRDKINLSFTPPNPFVPNLTSPTLNPQHHFLFPSGPGFPSYDPRFMAAYHNYLYRQRMPFSPAPPITSLSLELNQRKNFDLHTPTSPQLANLPQQQQSPKSGSSSLNSSTKPSSQSSKVVTTTSCSNSNCNTTTVTNQKAGKKVKDGAKNEKSLENAVEKLTQNRLKNDLKQDKPHEISKEDTSQQQEQQQQQQQEENKEECINKINKADTGSKKDDDGKDEKISDNSKDKNDNKGSEESTLNAKSDEEKDAKETNNKVYDKSNNNTETSNNISLVAVDKN